MTDNNEGSMLEQTGISLAQAGPDTGAYWTHLEEEWQLDPDGRAVFTLYSTKDPSVSVVWVGTVDAVPVKNTVGAK